MLHLQKDSAMQRSQCHSPRQQQGVVRCEEENGRSTTVQQREELSHDPLRGQTVMRKTLIDDIYTRRAIHLVSSMLSGDARRRMGDLQACSSVMNSLTILSECIQ